MNESLCNKLSLSESKRVSILLSTCEYTTFRVYWAIHAGLLTPLTFAQHRLSPLAAFTSGAYFLHNGRR